MPVEREQARYEKERLVNLRDRHKTAMTTFPDGQIVDMDEAVFAEYLVPCLNHLIGIAAMREQRAPRRNSDLITGSGRRADGTRPEDDEF